MSANHPVGGAGPSPVAIFEEAFAVHQRGDFHEASRLYRLVLEGDRAHFNAILHLGLICLQQGNPGEAEGLFRKSVDCDPTSADAHAALANVLLAQRRLYDAVEEYDSALAIDPDHAEANYGLAITLQGLKRYEEAIARYEKAVAIDPDYAEANYGLASSLQALDRHAQAVPCFEKALAIDPDYSEANYGLGIALVALGRDDEAIGYYQRAVAATPGFAEAHNNLGVALQHIGRLDDARAAFETAITLMPRNPGFYLNLVDCKKITPEDRHLAALQAMAQDATSLSDEDRIYLYFALGKVLAEVGEHQRSFQYLIEGGALKRQQEVYDEATNLRMFARITAVFNAALMRDKMGQGNSSPLPVFIVGMPRSGSTLVEQMLASHPKVYGAGERLDLRDALNDFGVASDVELPFPERFLVASGDELRRLGTAYLDRLKAAAQRFGDFQRITDKLPANFRTVGLIHLILPNARIIHTCRDPIDTCLSCFSTLFTADQPYTYDLGECGRYYRGYSSLMEHWRQVVPPGVMLEVHYEELVADFERQARRIVKYCGLDWHEACLDFDKTARPVKTASSVQVRRPIYQSSVGRWRPEENVLRPLLDGLGPVLAGPAATR